MDNPRIVSREDWLQARTAHLESEKALTRMRDQVSAERRALPWVKVEKGYIFEGPNGKETLADLFAGKSQLIVQHFMYGPDWENGCKSCSFWADSFDGIIVHLKARDVAMVAVSRAPLATLEAFKKRMGWRFKWMSSLGNDFNHDYHVSFTPERLQTGRVYYNYREAPFPVSEAPGVSVFCRAEDGAVFHTYSCYARGLDPLNSAYQLLDLVPKGRDEDNLPATMSWLRHRDSYGS